MRPEPQPAPAKELTVPAAKARSQQPLFAGTVTVSKIRSPEGNALLGDVTDDKALRIVHRGHPIKVVVTEERYLELLTFWQLFEHQEPLPTTTAAEELAAAEQEDVELDALEAEDRD